MSKSIGIFPAAAAFLAGAAAGVLTVNTRQKNSAEHSGLIPDPETRTMLSNLEERLSAQETAAAARFAELESRLGDHAARLAAVPTTSQIVSAMEQILARTMSSLDERLTSQARAIETLKTTVTQTDNLLERVLESLDSLQSFTGPADFGEDPLLQKRPA
jgi:hypothetical protein